MARAMKELPLGPVFRIVARAFLKVVGEGQLLTIAREALRCSLISTYRLQLIFKIRNHFSNCFWPQGIARALFSGQPGLGLPPLVRVT
jgi:hypothetical protein